MTSPYIATLRRNLQTAFKRRHLEEASSILLRLREEAPLDVVTRASELELAILSKRLDEAALLCPQLLTAFPESPRVHLLAGDLDAARKDWKSAIEHYRTSEAIFSHNDTRLRLARALTSAGKLDQAEAILVPLVEVHPFALSSLAWLYERRGEDDRALRHYERALTLRPDDPYLQAQHLRLKGRLLGARDLIEEAENLDMLGEPIPQELQPELLKARLETGQGVEARRWVAEHLAELSPSQARKLGWIAHRALAPDLVVDLFLRALPEFTEDRTLLGALGSSAKKVGRQLEVAERLDALAPNTPSLYGRARRLRGT